MSLYPDRGNHDNHFGRSSLCLARRHRSRSHANPEYHDAASASTTATMNASASVNASRYPSERKMRASVEDGGEAEFCWTCSTTPVDAA